MKLPIFPLPVYLLPGGITRLRIFEQRYLNMVRDVNNSGGFAIRYSQQNNKGLLANWASWVNIVDFDKEADGVLSIDVMCEKIVSIDSFSISSDKLMRAEVREQPHWEDQTPTKISQDLVIQLKYFFSQNLHFNELYKEKFFDDAFWVCRRWLELIPINFEQKEHFIQEMTFNQTVEFIQSILLINNEVK